MTSGVYKITNLANGKVYIGSSVNCELRWQQHTNDILCSRHHSKHMMSAWKKYGKDNFQFEIIETADGREMLLEREQYWLDILKPFIPMNGYNTCRKADSPLGTKHSAATRKKIGDVQRGRAMPDKHKKKIAEAHAGKKKSAGHAKNISRGQSMFVGDKLNEMLRFRASGMSSLRIAKIYGCNKSTVLRTLRGKQTHIGKPLDTLPVERRATGRFVSGAVGKSSLTKDAALKIKEMLSSGANLMETSRAVGVGHKVVWMISKGRHLTYNEMMSHA